MTFRSNRVRAPLFLLAAVVAVGGPIPARADEAETVPQPMVTLNPYSLEFTPIPDMPGCATAAILRGNPRSEPAWVLLKLGSGCRVPWHWHTANETLVVISGRGRLEMKDGPPLDFVPGAYASLPSRHAHQAICSRECLLFNGADAPFDVNYVDEDGEEISLEEALKPSPKVSPKASPTPSGKKK
jgi:quercetin dioxygenase-like cupin family protein